MARQILGAREFCSSIKLVAGGTLSFPGTDEISQYLAQGGTYSPPCQAVTKAVAHLNNLNTLESANSNNDITYSDFRDPFYASTFPQCYALAAATVIAYMLVIMLIITPRSFIDGGVQVLGRRAGFTRSPSSAPSIGGRPWLQKVAALSVAISLTIASAETFKEAELQYSWGIENAKTIQREVLGGTLLKVIRLISSTFLWLAQAQTLIRLFPRRREKIIIRWTAGALILLDMLFDSLNSFLYYTIGNTRPRSFTQAVPALSYLFQLALGLLYAAWVLCYAVGKRKYAFYHRQMPNMLLVAVLSVTSILIPVVFFILDISKPDFAGWGDYVCWVGAAAASVAVWEWVERIEALEREDKKDGVLGREIIDADDLLDDRSSRDGTGNDKEVRDGSSYGEGTTPSRIRAAISSKLRRRWPLARHLSKSSVHQQDNRNQPLTSELTDNSWQRVSQPQDETQHSLENQPYQPIPRSPRSLSIAPASRTDSTSPTTVYHAYSVPNSPQFPAAVATNSTTHDFPLIRSDVNTTSNLRPHAGLHKQNDTQYRGFNISIKGEDPRCSMIKLGTNVDEIPEPIPNVNGASAKNNTVLDTEILNKPQKEGSRLRSLITATLKINQWRARMRDEPVTKNLPIVVIPPPVGPALQNPEVQAELSHIHNNNDSEHGFST